MFFAVYETLFDHIESYRARIAALIEEHEVIEEEIKHFYKKNDISGIMLFLRNLDGDASVSGTMSGGINSSSTISMENKMRLHAPESVEKLLPILPAIPKAASIRPQLKELIQEAFALQPDFDLKEL